ncbi:thioesterase II family protein [Micromonospora sp. DT48]|uniref:thioesterase II family protein n=1 Tax=unclassified Micromonospora TaxID=2617518 RepID=UPI0012BC7F50|nr:alpha/beta fold hydrolase [Micromonospora sp. CP22]MTK01201.1 thioesterase [Micromonospora sp. CP22]
MTAVELFCLPHAGGSAALFRPWTNDAPPGIAVTAVEYPGRGARRHEPMLWDLRALVDDVIRSCRRASGPYALFGHSLGGALALEVVRELARRGEPQPVRLIVSAAGPPGTGQRPRSLAQADDAAVLAEMRRIGGTPEALLREPEILGEVLEAFRAGVEILHQMPLKPAVLLDVPVTVLGGLDDHVVPASALSRWGETTVGPVSQTIFPGGHFFVVQHRRAVLDTVARQLRQDLLRPPAAVAVGARPARTAAAVIDERRQDERYWRD